MEYKEFVAFEESSRNKISLNKVYVDITGDLHAGLLLSQLVYWNLPSKKTKTKRSGEWLVKQREEWWEEVRLRPRQYDRASEILRVKQFVFIKVERSSFYNGNTAQHIKLNIDELMKAINQYFGIYEYVNPDLRESETGIDETDNQDSPAGEGVSPVRESRIDETGIPSITSTTTTITHPLQGGPVPLSHFESKTDLHNRLKYDFATVSVKLDPNGEPYYHDGKEAKAIDELIKRGMNGSGDFQKAYERIKTKAAILYKKISVPTKEHFMDMAFTPSILLAHWNNLREERPIKPKGKFAASMRPEILSKLMS